MLDEKDEIRRLGELWKTAEDLVLKYCVPLKYCDTRSTLFPFLFSRIIRAEVKKWCFIKKERTIGIEQY
jgi:hypothetical protein